MSSRHLVPHNQAPSAVSKKEKKRLLAEEKKKEEERARKAANQLEATAAGKTKRQSV